MQNSWLNKEESAGYVLRARKPKGSISPSITITRQGSSEAASAGIVITGLLVDTPTRIYFEGWLTI
jgi:hypothetical protein